MNKKHFPKPLEQIFERSFCFSFSDYPAVMRHELVWFLIRGKMQNKISLKKCNYNKSKSKRNPEN